MRNPHPANGTSTAIGGARHDVDPLPVGLGHLVVPDAEPLRGEPVRVGDVPLEAGALGIGVGIGRGRTLGRAECRIDMAQATLKSDAASRAKRLVDGVARARTGAGSTGRPSSAAGDEALGPPPGVASAPGDCADADADALADARTALGRPAPASSVPPLPHPAGSTAASGARSRARTPGRGAEEPPTHGSPSVVRNRRLSVPAPHAGAPHPGPVPADRTRPRRAAPLPLPGPNGLTPRSRTPGCTRRRPTSCR